MLVDPLTPRVEVLGSALISDRLERSGRNRFFLTPSEQSQSGLRPCLMACTASSGDYRHDRQLIAELIENRRNLAPGEVRRYDHAHNARLDSELYGQHWMAETAFSVIKRRFGPAVHPRAWYREFREVVLTTTVYSLEQALKQ